MTSFRLLRNNLGFRMTVLRETLAEEVLEMPNCLSEVEWALKLSYSVDGVMIG